jgi:hypothetical protein
MILIFIWINCPLINLRSSRLEFPRYDTRTTPYSSDISDRTVISCRLWYRPTSTYVKQRTRLRSILFHIHQTNVPDSGYTPSNGLVSVRYSSYTLNNVPDSGWNKSKCAKHTRSPLVIIQCPGHRFHREVSHESYFDSHDVPMTCAHACMYPRMGKLVKIWQDVYSISFHPLALFSLAVA